MWGGLTTGERDKLRKRHDTDLVPVLQFGFDRGTVETLGWQRAKKLKPDRGRIWDTRLGHDDFERCLDPKQYFPDP